jgi:hypothetical protein
MNGKLIRVGREVRDLHITRPCCIAHIRPGQILRSSFCGLCNANTKRSIPNLSKIGALHKHGELNEL